MRVGTGSHTVSVTNGNLTVCNFANDETNSCFDSVLRLNKWVNLELSQIHSNCDTYQYNIKLDGIPVYVSYNVNTTLTEVTRPTVQPASARVKNYNFEELNGT